MKVCRKCNQEKLGSDFYKNKTKPDGLQSICKACDKKRERIGKYDPQYMKSYNKQWRKDHPEYLKDWRNKNRKMHEGGLLQIPNSKECSRCHEVKTSDKFYPDTSLKDGLSVRCIDCDRSYATGSNVWKKAN